MSAPRMGVSVRRQQREKTVPHQLNGYPRQSTQQNINLVPSLAVQLPDSLSIRSLYVTETLGRFGARWRQLPCDGGLWITVSGPIRQKFFVRESTAWGCVEVIELPDCKGFWRA